MKALDFLQKNGFTDMVINPYDLPEYRKTLTQLMEEYAEQSRQAAVSGQSEQFVCDYCGKDKVYGLDHCKCYNGRTWVKKANQLPLRRPQP